jgi:uncharacterized protein with gpF-like domain
MKCRCPETGEPLSKHSFRCRIIPAKVALKFTASYVGSTKSDKQRTTQAEYV